MTRLCALPNNISTESTEKSADFYNAKTCNYFSTMSTGPLLEGLTRIKVDG